MPLKPAICPDCNVAMQRIKLIAVTVEHGPVELEYAAADLESLRREDTPSLGKVRGDRCPHCGRIVLRGVRRVGRR